MQEMNAPSRSRPARLSVCIPAYNRPKELERLLDSIAKQQCADCEIVICEDRSPKRDEIRRVVSTFASKHQALPVRYFENADNFGYDRNLRELIDKAEGEYCVFMGDDDVMMPHGLVALSRATEDRKVSFVLRAWESIDIRTNRSLELHRYFPQDRAFVPGAPSVGALFRRSVFFSGLTFRRTAAQQLHTDRFDGSLLYQLYLVGRLALMYPTYYVADVLVARMVGADHFFGSSPRESQHFSPRKLLPAHSVRFIEGLLSIAKALDQEHCAGIYQLVLADLSAYSYPILAIQAKQLNRLSFLRYANEIGRLGLNRAPLFWVYLLALLVLGPNLMDHIVRAMKRALGRTPILSRAHP